ncbi:MAG: T9SS type A sorting domain-containing protein [Ignavibacteria bacterium]|nr:T9SS type A sorting domain-containing protein [Ignavibacteria bacterium]
MNYNKIIFIFCLFASQSFLLAQSGWFQQSSSTNKSLKSVSFLNDNTGFAAGSGGVILKTTNSGINWINIYSVVIYDVRTVYFINISTGWAYIKGNISDSTFVIKTINSGLNWSKSFIDTSNTLFSAAEIKFLNENTGYMVNSINVRKTTNGGSNWQVLYPNVTIPSCLYFLNENTGWVAGFQTSIYKTSNGGLNWAQQFENQTNTSSRKIIFLNNSTGFYATDYGVYSTTNSGENWNESFYVFNIYPIALSFINSNTGWCLSSIADTSLRNVILKTTNSGVNWNIYELNLQNKKFNSIFFSSQNTGWIAGDSGYIYRSTNGGVPIGIQPTGNNIPLNFSLSQNYPNPFNPVTNINVDLPRNTHTLLIIFDALGREIDKPVNNILPPGSYRFEWDASNYPSGVYFYKLIAGNYIESKKMILIK